MHCAPFASEWLRCGLASNAEGTNFLPGTRAAWIGPNVLTQFSVSRQHGNALGDISDRPMHRKDPDITLMLLSDSIAVLCLRSTRPRLLFHPKLPFITDKHHIAEERTAREPDISIACPIDIGDNFVWCAMA